MNKITLSHKDIIWSYIGTIMSMASNFIILPFLMYFLSSEMLGLWYVFASIGAIATLFDFGFGVTFARNITYSWSGASKLQKEDVSTDKPQDTDFYLMKKVLVTSKYIYALLSVSAFILLVSIGTMYIRYVSSSIEGPVPIISWLIYSFALFLNLYYGYYATYLRGVGNIAQANINTIIGRGLQIILSIVFLWMGFDIIGASVAYLVYGTVFRILGKYFFYSYKNIGQELNKIEVKIPLSEIREMFSIVWHNAWRDGAISLCNYLSNQVSTIICSMYLPLSETGVYSIGVQIASAIAQIAGTLYSSYQPELQAAYINKNIKKQQKIMSIIVTSFVILFVIGTVGMIIVGIPILRFIKPTAVVSVPVLLGLCVYQFILKYRNCYTSYFSCTNRILYMNSFILSAAICVLLSFIAIGPLKLGVWGLIGAQIISQCIYNVWHWPIATHKELHYSMFDTLRFSKEVVLHKLSTRKNA